MGKNIKMKEHLLNAAGAIKRTFLQSLNNFRNPAWIACSILFVLSYFFSAIGFYNNNFNRVFGLSTYCQTEKMNNKESYLKIVSQSFSEIDDNNPVPFNTLSSLCNKISENQIIHSKTYSLITLNDNDDNLLYSSLSFSDTELQISSAIATFGDYLNEVPNSNTFASIEIEKYDTSPEGQDVRTRSFDGRDGASYISSYLADELIKLDKTDNYNSYDDLLGAKLDIFVQGKKYHLSINNIYFPESTYQGKLMMENVGSPIFTNAPVFRNNKYSLSVATSSEFACVDEIFMLLSGLSNKYKCQYSASLSNVLDIEKNNYFNKCFNETLLGIQNNSVLLFSGSNIVMVALAMVSITSLFVMIFILGWRGRLNNGHVLFFIICFVLIVIYQTIIYAIMFNSIKYYLICNIFSGCIGLFGSLVFAGLCYLFGDYDNEQRLIQENKN